MDEEWGEDSDLNLDQLAVLSNESSDYEDVPLSKLLQVFDRPEIYNKIKRKIHSPRTKKHYVTERVKPHELSLPKHATSPFRHPADLAVLAHDIMTKAWRNDARIKQLKLKCSEKTNSRGWQPRDIGRLYVRDPPKDSMKTVCDVDANYFEVIKSKPEKVNMKDYIQTLRDSLRTKIVNGYREDDIMLLDIKLLTEQKILDIIRENYQKYVNIFEEYLYEDHKASMQLLEDSEAAALEAYNEYEEYRLVARKLSVLRSNLCKSEEKWRNMKTYQRFLYKISPASWRATQLNCMQTHVYNEDEPGEELEIFGSYRQSIAERSVSLKEVVDVFYRDFRNERPQIYFTTPDQLLAVFRFLEDQNMNTLLHCEELAVPMTIVVNGLSEAKQILEPHLKYLQISIEKMERAILWKEDRMKHSIELAENLLNDQFRKITMDEDVLNLQVFVEDVYETRIGANTANLGMLEMMTEIENKYREDLLSMDMETSLELAIVQHACFEEELLVMQLAERATKQLFESQRMIVRLNKSYAPPFKKPGGKLVRQRSPVKEAKVIMAFHQPIPIEDEYLEYFTNFCRYTDNPDDYAVNKQDAFASIFEDRKPQNTPSSGVRCLTFR